MDRSSIVLLVLAVPAAIGAFSAAIYLFVVHVLRNAAGWRPLLALYRCDTQPAGNLLVRQTVAVGSVRLRRAGRLIIGPAGLYLRGGALGGAILVPWSHVVVVRNARIYRHPALELSIGAPEAGRISVSPELFQQIRPYLAQAAPLCHTNPE